MHLSDVLSRLTSHNDNSKAKSIPGLDITVHDVEVFTEISPLSLVKIKRVTRDDPVLQTLKQYIQDGFPENKANCAESVQDYFNFREELAVVDGLIVKGHCVVIPSSLQNETLRLLHSSHVGIVKTKERARTSFYWLNLNCDIVTSLQMQTMCNIPGETTSRNPAE